MDNIRIILLFSLAFIVMLIWQAWNEDFGPKPQPRTAVSESAPSSAKPIAGATPEVPSAPVKPETGVTGQTPAVPTPDGQVADLESGTVKVVTDLMTLELDMRGGSILNLFLNDYPVSLEQPDDKFELMRPTPPNLFVAQSGLIAGEGSAAPTHETLFQTTQQEFRLEDGKDTLNVDLFWTDDKGVRVVKRYNFTRGSYLVTVQHLVENNSGSPWTAREYRQLMRGEPGEQSADSQFLYTYTGGAIYSPEEKYDKISFDDMKESKLNKDVKGGWIAMLQHYFLGAWVPPPEQVEHYYTNVLPGGRYVLGAYTPPVTLSDEQSHTFSTGFVAGPKLQDELEAIAPGLELSVDYGWLTVLAKPIFWLLKQIQSVVINWGWSIILLTVLIKLAFFKLSETSYKSMANMRKMTPRIQALKDRYGDDKQRMNQAMMELYKKEKINPLGGCLPILVQIPVFIALYWVLLESVELRQAPFIFWLQDLSIKDPFYVLPLIMGISMFIQQKLNPAPPDPVQAKIMMSLPFVFTIFFAFFPSGLVLYWVTNNVLSIAQQWYITRQIEKAA
jgi:YidC/Oxa1 family membrane protein insertase